MKIYGMYKKILRLNKRKKSFVIEYLIIGMDYPVCNSV